MALPLYKETKSKLIALSITLFVSSTLWIATSMAEAVGTWKVYRSYSQIEDIQPAGNKVYVKAYGNIYSYNTRDNSIETYSKEDGLSTQDAKLISWCSQTKKLVIVYENYAIDLLDTNGDVQTNVWLKEKRMTTDKTVNSIYISEKNAYLCTAFGLIKLNTSDATISDTYNIGINIDSLSIYDGKLYAKSTSGAIYRADSNDNLYDKANWTETTASWNDVNNNRTTYSNDYGIIIYDDTNKCYWGSNAEGKLTQYDKNEEKYTAKNNGVIPVGPKYPEHAIVKKFNNKVHTLRGLYNVDANSHAAGYVQLFDGTTWSLFDNSFAADNGFNPENFMTIDIDPTNSHRIMVGGSDALYEYTNGKMTAQYSGNALTDSPIIMSLCFDSSGNLWIFNRWNQGIVCQKKDGTWETYTPQTLVDKGLVNRCISPFFDTRGLLWFCHNHFNPNFFGFYNPKTNTTHIIDDFVNQDGININPKMTHYSWSVTEDANGNVWLGTSNYTIYVTSDDIRTMMATTDNNAVNVTQHKVARNDGTGLADYLLNSIGVRDIKVDNANRKWVATSGNGVYLISSDNNTELAHFTTDNSLLPTDDVHSICIDDENGKVYFGTLNGLCCYETGMSSNYGSLSANTVYAYPNPVTPEYTGPITIKGLIENAQLKITTSSGYIVHEGVSNGPTYQWDGCDQNGNRVASGVYMVLITNALGEDGCVTKIAMVK